MTILAGMSDALSLLAVPPWAFSAFYRDCPVLDADTPALRASRLALCDATRQVLARALDLVGVGAPAEM